MGNCSVLSPAIGEKPVELTGFHGIDSAENISEVCDGVDVVSLAGDNEGEVYGHGSATGVGADKQKVLPRKDEVLDCSLVPVVVDLEIWVSEEAIQGNPMLECVFYALHEGMSGVKRASELDQLLVQMLSQRLRLFAPDCQSVCRRLVFDLSFDAVQLAVYLYNLVTQMVVLSA